MLFNYPKTKREDIADHYHGTRVEDPYRWLEDPENPAVKEWTQQQNHFTKEYLADIASYQRIKDRLSELWRFTQYSNAIEKGRRLFFRKNNGHQNQPALYVREQNGQESRLVDPNLLSEDGTIALMNEFYTRDGAVLAYSLAESGSDWQKVYLLDTVSGKHLEDVLEYTKFPQIAWSEDQEGFFYNRLPDPKVVPPEDRNNFRQVCWHKLGTPQTDDVVVFQPGDKNLGVSPTATEDGKYLLLWIYRGTDHRNGLYFREFSDVGAFIKLFDVEKALFNFIGNEGEVFYIHTDLEAPRGRIVAVNIREPDPKNWETIIGESEDAIDDAMIVNGKIVVRYFHNAYHVIELFSKAGIRLGEIPLPDLGTVVSLSGSEKDKKYYFLFSSFMYPDSVFYYDFDSDEVKPIAQDQGIDFPVEEYETYQEFYSSKDGTKVPIFLTHKKGLKRDGQNPTILYGYGGFNLAQTPFFKVWNLTWLEMGGIFALANLRGGNEYGEEWHQAGMLGKKQNVFDDFHAAAEWLIQKAYSNPARLAIEGRSNGGLLTAACMLQRPDLYGAVLCHVPVIDMLRYHKFTLGHYWMPEYGNAEENPEHFNFMIAYSPLHNIKNNDLYPPVIVTTADTDDRVVPAHAKKFIATLQNNADPANPYLLRVEEHAGHGLGKPISKLIEERSDCWAFLVNLFDIDL